MSAPRSLLDDAALTVAEGGRVDDPHVRLVVVHWRRAADTARCLRSLAELEYRNFSVIVVDNGSGDRSGDEVASAATGAGFVVHRCGLDASAAELASPPPVEGVATPGPALWLIDAPTNAGYAGGVNRAVAVSKRIGGAPWTWLLNADLVVAPDSLGALVRRCQHDPAIAVCGARQYLMSEDGEVGGLFAAGGFGFWPWLGHSWSIRVDGSSSVIDEEVEARLAGVHGAAVFARTELLEATPFDEDRFLFFEEQQLALAVRRAGLRLGYASAAVVHHVGGTSLGSGHVRTSELSRYFMARSRLLFTVRYRRLAVPTVLAYELFHACVLTVRDGWPYARATLRGTVDGLLGRVRHFPALEPSTLTTGGRRARS